MWTFWKRMTPYNPGSILCLYENEYWGPLNLMALRVTTADSSSKNWLLKLCGTQFPVGIYIAHIFSP